MAKLLRNPFASAQVPVMPEHVEEGDLDLSEAFHGCTLESIEKDLRLVRLAIPDASRCDILQSWALLCACTKGLRDILRDRATARERIWASCSLLVLDFEELEKTAAAGGRIDSKKGLFAAAANGVKRSGIVCQETDHSNCHVRNHVLCDTYAQLLDVVRRFRPEDTRVSKAELQLAFETEKELQFCLADEWDPAWLNKFKAMLAPEIAARVDDRWATSKELVLRALRAILEERKHRKRKLDDMRRGYLPELFCNPLLWPVAGSDDYPKVVRDQFDDEEWETEWKNKAKAKVITEFLRNRMAWGLRDDEVKKFRKQSKGPKQDGLDNESDFEECCMRAEEYLMLFDEHVELSHLGDMFEDAFRTAEGNAAASAFRPIIVVQPGCLEVQECQASLGMNTVTFREVCISCTDLFKLEPEKNTAFARTFNLVKVERSKASGDEKSFQALLLGLTPDRMHLFSTCELKFKVKEVVFKLSMSSTTWRAESNSDSVWCVPVAPLGYSEIWRRSEGTERLEKCFRVALVFDRAGDPPEPCLRRLAESRHGIAESAALLKECMEFSRHGENDGVPGTAPRLSMGLTHHVSPALRMTVFPELDGEVARHWNRELRVESNDMESHKVAKETVCALMNARYSVAVIPGSGGSVAKVKQLIADSWSLPVEYALEVSNFQAFLRQIKALRGTAALSFFIVMLVDSMPPINFLRILEVTRGQSVRLLLVDNGNLRHNFDLLGRADEVFVAERASLVGKGNRSNRIVREYTEMQELHCPELSDERLAEAREMLCRAIDADYEWQASVRQWITKPLSSSFLLVVSELSLEPFFAQEVSDALEVVHCGAAELDSQAQTVFQKLRRRAAAGVVVFLDCHLISSTQRAFFFGQALECNCASIMVAPALHPSLTAVVADGEVYEATVIRAVEREKDADVRALKMLLGPVMRADEAKDKIPRDELLERWSARLRGTTATREALLQFWNALEANRHVVNQNASLMERLASFLVRVDAGSAVSFSHFVSEFGECQGMTQRDRVIHWLRLLGMDKESVERLELPSGAGTHSCHVLPFLCEKVTERSTYACLENRHGVDSEVVLVEQCAQGEELDWEAYWQEWSVAFTHSVDVALTTLRFYPFSLKLLLAFSPRVLFFTFSPLSSVSALLARKLAEVVRLSKVLQLSPQAECTVSVLRWIMVCKLRRHEDWPPDLLRGSDVENLLRCKIPLSIPSYRTDPKSFKTLVATLFRLDEPLGVLYDQPSLRSDLLSVPSGAAGTVLTACTEFGASFWDFCLQHEVRQARGELVRHELVIGVVEWLEGKGRCVFPPTILSKCTEKAIALFLVQCSSVMTNSLMEELRKLCPQKLARILGFAFGRASVSVVVKVFMESGRPIVGNVEYFKWLGDFLASDSYDRLPPSPVPFHVHPKLIEGFLRFKEPLQLLEFCDSGTEEILLSHCLKNDVDRGLVYKLWSRCPHVALPDSKYPGKEDEKLLRELVEDKEFGNAVSASLRTVSTLALFLAAPGYLHLGVYNYYAAKCTLKERPVIQPKIYDLAQTGKDNANRAYTICVASRPVPKSYADWLLSQKLNIVVWPSWPEHAYLHLFEKIDVERGVSKEIVETNLSAFCCLFVDNCDENERYVTNGVLRNLIVSFFCACGLYMEALLQNAGLLSDKIRQFLSDPPKVDRESPVKFPMPSTLETSLVNPEPSLCQFMGEGRANMLFTRQVLSAFAAPRGIELAEHILCVSDVVEPFGRKVIDLLNDMKCAGGMWDMSQLESMLSPFVWAVRQVCSGFGDAEQERRMVDCFLKTVARDCEDPAKLAMVSRVLIMSLLGGKWKRLRSVCQFTVRQVAAVFKTICEATRLELKWMDQEGFSAPRLPQELSRGTLYRRAGSAGTLKVYFEESVEVWWKRPSVVFVRSEEASTMQAATEATEGPARAGVAKEERDSLEHSSVGSGYQVTLSVEPFRAFVGPAFVDAGELLFVNSNVQGGFATLCVKPGLRGVLLRDPDTNYFRYAASYSEADRASGKEIAFVFRSSAAAWETLSTALPPLSILFLGSIWLRREQRGRFWVPIVGRVAENVKKQDETIPFWRLFGIGRLLGLDIMYKRVYQKAEALLFWFREALLFLMWAPGKECPCGCVGPKYKTWSDLQKHICEGACVNKMFLEMSSEMSDRFSQLAQHAAELVDVFVECRKAESAVKNVEVMARNRLRKSALLASLLKEGFEKKLAELMQDAGPAGLTLTSNLLRVDERCDGCIRTRFFGSEMMDKARRELSWLTNSPDDVGKDANQAFRFGDSTTHADAVKRLAYFDFCATGNGLEPTYDLQAMSLLDPKAPPLFFVPVVERLTLRAQFEPVVMVLLPFHLFPKGISVSALKQFGQWLERVIVAPLFPAERLEMLRLSRMHAMGFKEISSLPGLSVASRVVLHSLAMACDLQEVREVLVGAFPLPVDIEPYARLKSPPACFSLYFVDSHTLCELERLHLPVEVIDLHAAALSGSVTNDELYLRVISCFDAATCFVYVRGLSLLDDLFLKWLAEHTKRYPWRFIYIESADPTFNFAETRDRSDVRFFSKPTLTEWRLGKSVSRMDINRVEYAKHRQSCTGLDIYGVVQAYWRGGLGPYVTPTDDPERNWHEELLVKLASEDRQRVLMLQSPPGAGKTYTVDSKLRGQFERNGYHVEYIDCSDDVLVERSLLFSLQERMPNDVAKGLLVMDEYHFLSKSHRATLFSWILTAPHIVVLIIANRIDSFDADLMESLRKRSAESVSQFVETWQVCLTRLYMLRNLEETREDRARLWVEVWSRSARALFGDEILSMRVIPIVVKHMDAPLEAARVILDKMPSLGSVTSLEFSMHIYQFFQDLLRGQSALATSDKETSPFRVLIRASLLQETSKLCPFPTFVRNLPGACEAHPLVRLSAWVMAVYSCNKMPYPSLIPLLKLRVIDQQGFPLVVSVCSDVCSFWTGESFSRPGDYTQLAWMKQSLQKGYAIDWKQVHEVWRTRSVTDVAAFEELLSSCPDPRACLSALRPANLCVLIEQGRKTLWELTVAYGERAAGSADLLDVPVFKAAWKLTLANGELPPSISSCTLEFLSWCSKNCDRMNLTVPGAAAVQVELVSLTNEILAQFDRDGKRLSATQKLSQLWCFAFQPLLQIGCDVDAKTHVPLIVALFLASSRSSICVGAHWQHKEHSLLRSLNDLFFGGVLSASVPGLDIWRKHAQRVDNSSVLAPVARFPCGFGIGSIVLCAAVAAKTTLLLQWQRLVLSDHDRVAVPAGSSLEDVLELLKEAVLESDWTVVEGYKNCGDGEKRPCEVRARAAALLKNRSETVKAADEWTPAEGAEKQRKFRMRYLQRCFPKCEISETTGKILKYYTELTMATSAERIREGSDEDPLKGVNPTDPARFDLGRAGAFSEFSLLIGAFYTWDKFVQNYKAHFESVVEKELRSGLGFHVKVVYTEREFMDLCDPKRFHVAFVISSNCSDWQRRNGGPLKMQDWKRFSDVCVSFHRAGRGLFLFAEQDPLFDHANVVLARIAGAKLVGELPGDAELVMEGYEICRAKGCDKRFVQDSKKSGKFCARHAEAGVVTEEKVFGTFKENAITGSLNSLFEGSTICYADPQGLLTPFACSSDRMRKNCLFFGKPSDDFGAKGDPGMFPPCAGRVIVDTGFTKLWMQYGKAEGKGTDRYIRNGTVWLLGLDYRLSRNLSLTDPLKSDAPPQHLLLPLVEPPPDYSAMLDILFCIDGSGSVGETDFKRALESVKGVVDQTDFSLCQVGVLQFDSRSYTEVPLSSKKEEVIARTQSIRFRGGGTDFRTAFRGALDEWRARGRKDHQGFPLGKFVLVFQTDGDGGSGYHAELSELKALKCDIVAVGVGNSVNVAELKSIAGSTGMYVAVGSYAMLPKILASTMKEFTALSTKFK